MKVLTPAEHKLLTGDSEERKDLEYIEGWIESMKHSQPPFHIPLGLARARRCRSKLETLLANAGWHVSHQYNAAIDVLIVDYPKGETNE